MKCSCRGPLRPLPCLRKTHTLGNFAKSERFRLVAAREIVVHEKDSEVSELACTTTYGIWYNYYSIFGTTTVMYYRL
jgi:hypothetical protein